MDTKRLRVALCSGILIGIALGCTVIAARRATAVDCVSLLPLFQQGGSDAAIAGYTGLPFAIVESCHRELSRPLAVGPAGAPPMGAAGPPPVRAVGPPPVGAAGAPPFGAAGPPPVGSTIKR